MQGELASSLSVGAADHHAMPEDHMQVRLEKNTVRSPTPTRTHTSHIRQACRVHSVSDSQQ